MIPATHTTTIHNTRGLPCPLRRRPPADTAPSTSNDTVADGTAVFDDLGVVEEAMRGPEVAFATTAGKVDAPRSGRLGSVGCAEGANELVEAEVASSLCEVDDGDACSVMIGPGMRIIRGKGMPAASQAEPSSVTGSKKRRD